MMTTLAAPSFFSWVLTPANQHPAQKCAICNQSRNGACVQCEYKSCPKAFHVGCARLSPAAELEIQPSGNCVVYCEQHAKVGCGMAGGGRRRGRERER